MALTHIRLIAGSELCTEPGTFALKTCLRALALRCDGQWPALDGDRYSGREAYSYMLQFSCGLLSRIPGETDVFGQIKEAWGKTSNALLHPWMMRLFEDTKRIRSEYLHDTGGSSYGTVVRKYLKKRGFLERYTIIGAGALAESLAECLAGTELRMSARSMEKAENLARRFGAKTVPLDDAWKEPVIILCAPQGAERLDLLGQSVLLHMGMSEPHPAMLTLHDIFAFQKEQGEKRSSQLARALNACHIQARLRALEGTSKASSHGWEDLEFF